MVSSCDPAGGMTPAAAAGTILQEYLGLNVIYTPEKRTRLKGECKLYK